jgi:hypothetical protein
MRRIAPAFALLIAGCASTPEQPPVAQPAAVVRPLHVATGLLGLSAAELVGKLGNPALQVREGAGLKLQFRSTRCVLDAYLYLPPGGGPERVTHIDARLPSGADMDQAACVSVLERRI